MLKFAITGNIASGKTEVENILISKGFKVLDTDNIAHEILETSSEIKEKFKTYDIFDSGTISRKKLGKLVFSDKNLLLTLENIVHPIVKQKIIEFFNINSSEKCVFVSIPQLFESGMQNLFDKIIFVYAPDNLRLKRLIERNNYSLDYAQKRLSAQDSQANKIKKSDFVIDNSYSMSELKKQVEDVLKQV